MTRSTGILALLALLAANAASAQPEEYAALMQTARQALRKRAFDEAATACRKAERAARHDTPLDQARALQLCGDVEMRRERWRAAMDRYGAAARNARADLRLREKLLYARKNAAQKAKATRSVELVGEVLEADRTLRQTMRRPRRRGASLDMTLAALSDAEKIYRRDRDRARAAEARAVRGLVLVRSGKPDEGVQIAERLISGRRTPRHAAMTAHQAMATALLAKGEIEAAARSAVRFNHLRNQELPEERRPHSRAPLLERACAKLGPGACTRLELELTGEITFTDFSKGRRKKELSEEDIERVHAQALPALEACVLAAARKEPEFYRGVDIQLSWSIDPEGRAIQIDLSPKRNRPDILPCAEKRLSWLRYPKVFSRERKNVVIPYHLD